MDVHINRVPYGGTLTRVTYQPGRFLPAYRSESGAQNERTELWVERDGPHRRVPAGRRRAGAARRLPRAAKATTVKTGDRFGLMKFGSRMDVFVDRDARLLVKAGDTVRAGETRLAEFPARQGRHAVLKARRFVPTRDASTARGCAAAPTCCPACSRWATCSAATPASSTRCAHEFEHGGAVHRLRHRPRHARRPHRAHDRHDERVRRRVRLAGRRRVVRHGAGRPVRSRGACRRFGQAGWAAGFVFVSAAAVRLARFNIQTNVPGRTSATSSACRARRPPACRRRRCSRIPTSSPAGPYNLLALPMVLVPAFLMVSTIRYRSFKTIDLRHAALAIAACC